MKKAISSKYGKSVTVIERADWSIKFYDVETGRHYTRRVWYQINGSDIYVQHRGGFYSIATEYAGKYDPQAISRYDVVTPEELAAMTAEIIEHRAGKQYADDLAFEEVTRVYAYAIICRDADAYATMRSVVNGILQDRSRQPESIQVERAAIIPPYLVWEDQPETDTPENHAAEDAAFSLIDAYAEAIGERPAETDPEFTAALRVAAADVAGKDADGAINAAVLNIAREYVATMVEAIAARWMQDHQPEPAPTYQRAELEAFLGDYADAYDVDAIEAEATEAGRWTPEAARDLMSICERHELKA